MASTALPAIGSSCSVPPVQPNSDAARRRDLMRQAACVAGAWVAASALPVVAAGEPQRHASSLLVDAHGNPWLARQLKPGEAFLFNYRTRRRRCS